jgi:hypothetical protein
MGHDTLFWRALVVALLIVGGFLVGHDTPDWGGKYVNEQFYPLDDHAELAARLWSPVTHDRRGAVLWMTDFRHGLRAVEGQALGTGSAIALDAGTFESAPFSVALTAGTAAGATASMLRRQALTASRRVGYAGSYRFGSGADTLYHNIYYTTGAIRYYTYLKLDLIGETLQVRTGDAGLVTLDYDVIPIVSALYYVHLKIVADLSDQTLVRAVIDDTEFDLSAHTMAQMANTDPAYWLGRSTHENNTGVGATINADNLILTANEP